MNEQNKNSDTDNRSVFLRGVRGWGEGKIGKWCQTHGDGWILDLGVSLL